MIKKPQLLDQLRKQELRKADNFTVKVHRYEEMYKLAGKLNPEILREGSGKHLEHLIQLADTLRKMSEKQGHAGK